MNVKKKIIAGLMAGAFVLGGLAFAYPANAAESNDASRPAQNRQFQNKGENRKPPTKEEITKHIAEMSKLDQAKVKSLMDSGYHPRDIEMAGKLANKSKKSVESVLGMKKINNNWKDVAKSLGIALEKDDNKMQRPPKRPPHQNKGKDAQSQNNGEKKHPPTEEERIKHIAEISKLDQAKVKSLMDSGYHPRDIEMAGKFANKSKKSVETVLGMKKINNNWKDVAKSLGIALEKDDDKMQRPPKHKNPRGENSHAANA